MQVIHETVSVHRFRTFIRFRYSDWIQKMRHDSIAVFSDIAGLELVVPEPSPDGVTLDKNKGSPLRYGAKPGPG
jgi:hypothetical protein